MNNVIALDYFNGSLCEKNKFSSSEIRYKIIKIMILHMTTWTTWMQ